MAKSFGASAISFVLVDVTSMPSTYDVEKLAYDSSAMVELLLCSELLPTLTKQLGATVISPIASDDVHFRRSSMAAGYNYSKHGAKRKCTARFFFVLYDTIIRRISVAKFSVFNTK